MMPHPERASEDVLGMRDGLKLLHALVDSSAVRQ
jgi:phosphoribosylformylglycinamidine (FGAM) synthase-like amidotransferase family enzyme